MSDRETVLFANEAFYAAFLTRDADGMAALWSAERPVCCIHPGWPPVRGRDEVIGSWRGILGSPNAPKIRCFAAEADVHGDCAIVTCIERIGEQGVLAATNVFVRSGSRWLMVHHHAGPANVDPRQIDAEESERARGKAN
jgi:hypothetical protein